MSQEIIIALILVLAIPAWFFGGLLLKLLWGWWAIPLFPAMGGYMVYQNGLESFIYLPLGIVAGIMITWFWQLTAVFAKGDEIIGKYTLID